MALIDQLTSTLIGARSAAIFFGIMGLLAWQRAPRSASPLDWYKSVTWGLFALAMPPLMAPYTLRLLGDPMPKLASLITLIVGTLIACCCLITMLASRALIRGISLGRVNRGVGSNFAVLAALVVAALWLAR